eukprot:Opistho-2@43323
MRAPVCTSHSRTVLSQLPDATVHPSGEYATEYTLSECPLSVTTDDGISVFLRRSGRQLDQAHANSFTHIHTHSACAIIFFFPNHPVPMRMRPALPGPVSPMYSALI